MNKKLISILTVLIVLVVWVCTSFIDVGKYDIYYSCFAVDDYGKVYLGCEENIKVYENDQYLYSVYSGTNRGYSFTITDNRLLVDVSGKTFFINYENGERVEEPAEIQFNDVRKDLRTFTDSHGNNYKMTSKLGRTQIINTDTGEKVFEMSKTNYTMKVIKILVDVFAWVAIIVIVFVNIVKSKEKTKIRDEI